MTQPSPPRSPAPLRFARIPLSGWGRQPVQTCDAYRPETEAEVDWIVDQAPQQTLTPRGLGRSYGDAALNPTGAVLLSTRLDRMLDFEPESGRLRCQAAVSLADVLHHFLPRGFFLPVTPGTKRITLGGAIAADVHGKNHHTSGSMSAWVRRFRLRTGTGEVLECSREQNADAFWATVGGMGLTGVILDTEIQLKPVATAYMDAHSERVPDLDRLLDRMDESDRDYDYAVAWVDGLATGASLGRAVLMRANHAELEALPAALRAQPLEPRRRRELSVPMTLPNFAISRPSIRAFNAAFYAAHPTREQLRDCDAYFYPLDRIRHWNRAYGRRGMLQYQCVIPEAVARPALRRLLETLQAAGAGPFLTVLKSLGPADDGLLSFPMQGKTIAMDLPYTGADLIDTLNALDAIVLETGGRVYLAKDACLTRPSFESMYPRLDAFKRIQRRLDPNARFSSSQAVRLGLVGGV